MIVFKGEVSSKCKEFLLKEETKNSFISTLIACDDSRGFDVLSADKEFLKMLFNKYKKDIVDFDDIEFNN